MCCRGGCPSSARIARITRDDVGIVPYEFDRTAVDPVGVDAHIDPNREAADGAQYRHGTNSVVPATGRCGHRPLRKRMQKERHTGRSLRNRGYSSVGAIHESPANAPSAGYIFPRIRRGELCSPAGGRLPPLQTLSHPPRSR